MLRLKKELLFLPLSVMFLSYTDMKHFELMVIEGKVITRHSSLPVKGAHVYITSGEEEDLTNNEGKYRITTWQSLPVTLTVEHKNYETVKLKISGNLKNQVIELKEKHQELQKLKELRGREARRRLAKPSTEVRVLP
jgi:hypothetical protein